jgi:hypothetical protein
MTARKKKRSETAIVTEGSSKKRVAKDPAHDESFHKLADKTAYANNDRLKTALTLGVWQIANTHISEAYYRILDHMFSDALHAADRGQRGAQFGEGIVDLLMEHDTDAEDRCTHLDRTVAQLNPETVRTFRRIQKEVEKEFQRLFA